MFMRHCVLKGLNMLLHWSHLHPVTRTSGMNKAVKVAALASFLLVIFIAALEYTNMKSITYTPLKDTWLTLATNKKTTVKWKPSENDSFWTGVKHNKSHYEENKLLNRTLDINVTNRTKVTHIAFLKVHKAASTTIQNMLFRFGLRHNLNILLPKKGNHIWRKAEEMPINDGQHYDIFAIHTIYNKTFFDSLLPAGYVNIGIVREPLSRVISAAFYHRDLYNYKYLLRIPRANYIHNLINFPEKYDPDLFSQTRNTMAQDFGFSDKLNPQTDGHKIKRYLNELNFEFLFVMIMEKFDESLVYLRRLLNWSISDILYIKTNSYKHPPVVLNEKEKQNFRRTNSLDFDVYIYFKNVFNEKLKHVSNDFWEEVTYLKKLLKGVALFCDLRNSSKSEAHYFSVAETKFNEPFNVSSLDCKMLKTAELAFIEDLRLRHNKLQNITCLITC